MLLCDSDGCVYEYSISEDKAFLLDRVYDTGANAGCSAVNKGDKLLVQVYYASGSRWWNTYDLRTMAKTQTDAGLVSELL